MSRIYLSAPDVRSAEREALLAALDGGWIAPIGPDLDGFEADLAAVTGRGHGVGLASGTAAIHLALHDLGIGAGDQVLVSSFTFAGSAFPVVHAGATPVFVDCEATTWNLSPDLLADALEHRRRAGTAMPRAAVVVDLYGQCADYDRIIPLLDDHGIVLVEDAAEAIGASVGGRPAGSFGHCAALSFNGNKLITSSGGGALVCDDEQLAARYRHLATQAREPAPHYEHIEVGFNYRLSNLLAAFGRGQLATLAERIERRRAIRARYAEVFAAVPGVALNPIGEGHEPNHWLTCITVDPAVAGFEADGLRHHLEAADIESRPTWKPMHLQPVFQGAPHVVDGTSEAIFRTGLCLPSGSGMSDDDLDRTLDAITAFTRSGAHP
jgi:pyridoxal phosphate-dependent aminotransferase EpsN